MMSDASDGIAVAAGPGCVPPAMPGAGRRRGAAMGVTSGRERLLQTAHAAHLNVMVGSYAEVGSCVWGLTQTAEQ